MKRSKLNKTASLFAVLGIALLSGCGKSGSSSGGSPSLIGSNSSGFPTYGSGQCYPLSSGIPFVGQGIYYDYATIAGGLIPSAATYSPYAGRQMGVINTGGDLSGGPYQKSSLQGLISMRIDGGGYVNPQVPSVYPGTYPSVLPGQQVQQGNVNVAGFVQVSSQVAAQYSGYGYTYPGSTPNSNLLNYPGYGNTGSQVCVSGVAIALGHNNYSTVWGHVYLYLNGTTHGIDLYL